MSHERKIIYCHTLSAKTLIEFQRLLGQQSFAVARSRYNEDRALKDRADYIVHLIESPADCFDALKSDLDIYYDKTLVCCLDDQAYTRVAEEQVSILCWAFDLDQLATLIRDDQVPKAVMENLEA